MRVRMIIACATAGVALVTLPATAHTVRKACHGGDRVVTTHDLGQGIAYIDDRGFLGSPDTDPMYDAVGRDKRVPALSRRADPGGYWLYLETNGHRGLQSGGEHAVLGESGGQLGFTDPCRATHRKGARTRATWGYDSILF